MTTREEHLRYCTKCVNKKFDAQQGIICALTGRIADFEGHCPTFKAEQALVAPEEDQAHHKLRVERELAGLGKRFANYLIDWVICYLLIFIVGIIMAIFIEVFFPEEMSAFDEPGTPWWSYLLTILVFVFYYTMMESVFGRTIGKLITGTKVVDSNGKTPSTGVIFRRSLSRLVPFEPFSFLGSERGWHDRWTDTYVVNMTR